MKLLAVTMAMLTLSSAAQARNFHSCEGVGQSSAFSMTLTPVGQTTNDVNEGEQVPYSLVVYLDNEAYFGAEVQAQQEDVMFQFSGANANGTIFLDELDQSYANIKGQEIRFDCGR